MMEKRRAFSKMLGILLVCSMVFGNQALSALAAPAESTSEEQQEYGTAKAGTFQITDEDELKAYFPDDNFRAAVFKAVRDGNGGAEGNDVEDALYHFRGTVKYNKLGSPEDEKIKDVHGIEYLRNAELVSLKYNEIRDFRFLEKKECRVYDPVEERWVYDPAHPYTKWYGQLIADDPDIEWDEQNVVWDFAGNPIEKLPVTFGGRLKILQPGSSSYTYQEDMMKQWIYLRPESGGSTGGQFDIEKTEIWNGSVKEGDAWIDNCSPYYGRQGDTDIGLNIESFTDQKATFTGPAKSGTAHLSVGTKTDLNYGTQDEWTNVTPGAQSHKYYLTYTFKVYDKITVSAEKGGDAKLIKTDKDTKKPIQGAVYGVYKADGTQIDTQTTDKDGAILASGLPKGDYYFKEITAPAGYKLNADEVPFSINASTTGTLPKTTVSGGVSEIETTDKGKIQAGTNEVLFCGGYDSAGNPLCADIALSSDDAKDIKSVQVTYSQLEAAGVSTPNVVRTFTSLDAAQEDINKEKNYDVMMLNSNGDPTTYLGTNILGPVSVKVFYNNPDQQKPVQVETTDEALPRTSVTVNKTWIDKEDRTGKHPAITVQLLQNGTEIDSVTLQDGDTTHTFTDLIAEDVDGNPYQYTVKEEAVNGYTSNIIEKTTGTFEITNTFENTETISVSGKKVWVDNNDALHLRPATITVGIFKQSDADNLIKEITVQPDANGDWSYTVDGLAKYEADGKKISYIVKETSTSPDYTATVSGTTITNTVNRISISFVKNGKLAETCVDPAIRDITKLLAGAEFTIYEDKACTKEIQKAVSDEKGVVTFTAVPAGPSYYIKETKAPENYQIDTKVYEATFKANDAMGTYEIAGMEDGSITNDLYRTDIRLKKVSEQDQSHELPGSTYGLYKKTSDIPNQIKEAGTKARARAAQEDSEWTKIAEATTDQDGMLVFEGVLVNTRYQIRELVAPSGSHVSAKPIEIEFAAEPDKDGNIVVVFKDSQDGNGTAKIDPETGEVVWLEPSIMLGFSKTDMDGNMLSGAKLELQDESGNVIDAWTSTNEEYIIYGDKMEGKILAGKDYRLVEKEAPKGYEIADPIEFTVESDNAEPGVAYVQKIVMKDEKTAVPLTSVEVQKTWSDKGNESSRPKSITISLYRDDDSNKEYKTITLDSQSGWKATFENLPKVTEDGKTITYSLKESTVSGYKLTTQKAEVNEDGSKWSVVFTNEKVPGESGGIENPKTPIKKGTTAVKTGDSTTWIIYGLLIAISAGIGTHCVLQKKRRKKRVVKI